MASRGVRAPASRVSLVVGLAVVAMCLVLATPARAATPQTFHVTLGTANANMSLMGMAFFPSSLTVHQGDVLVFTDDLIEPHTVTFGVSGPIGNPFAFEVPQNLTGPGTGRYSSGIILNSGILVPGGPFGSSLAVAAGGGDGVSTVMRFFPSDLTVHVGDTVTFVDRDPFTPHTVTFGIEPPGGIEGLVPPANRTFPFSAPTAYDGSFNLNSGLMLSIFPWGNTFSVTFTAPGTYRYICGLHDLMGMTGSVTVTS